MSKHMPWFGGGQVGEGADCVLPKMGESCFGNVAALPISALTLLMPARMGETGDRPRFLSIPTQNSSSDGGASRRAGRPGFPGEARRPSALATSAAKRSLPRAKFPFVALRMVSVASRPSGSLNSARYAACRDSVVSPSAR